MKTLIKRSAQIVVLALALLAAGWAGAIEFKSIVVFGGSVSDSGNIFALTGMANKPPYSELDAFLIPTGAYAVGGHHTSNGPTWIEQFARPLGLSRYVQPAFQGSSRFAANYAVAGARSTDVALTLDMPEQIAAFLSDHGGVAPSDALYVIDFGGNDVRDALAAGDPTIVTNALGALADKLNVLFAAGARKFLVLNVADIGQIPSIRILDTFFPGAAQTATLLTQGFNAGLDAIIASLTAIPGVEVAKLDVFATVNVLIAHPAEFGLTNVTSACITPNVAPFACKRPDKFLFWDGIHPTKAVQAIFAQEAAEVLETEKQGSEINVATK